MSKNGVSELTGTQSFNVVLKDGKEYTFSELTMGDFGRIENDLRNARREELKKMLDEKPDLEFLKYIDEEVRKVNIFDGVTSMQGLLHMMRYSLKKKHPQLTTEEIGDLMTFESMQTISTQLTELVQGPVKNVEGQTESP